MKKSLIITCEHASNAVPPEFEHLFTLGDVEVLASHRGWDPGALDLATNLSATLGTPFFRSHVTRLLVEANRSLHNEQLFSTYTAGLNDEDKKYLIDQYYYPYRKPVEEAIRRLPKPVVHFSIHTFTPVWVDRVRKVDIGLLFDPARSLEFSVCEQLKTFLQHELKQYVVEFNDPYQGTDDGFTTYLRTFYPDEEYAGIEIEVNQKYVGTPAWETITTALTLAMKKL